MENMPIENQSFGVDNGLKPYYWVCRVEGKIYHSNPTILFRQKKTAANLLALGITKREVYKKLSLSVVLSLCKRMTSHYAFSAYTVKEYTIIDCPELQKIQDSYKLNGNYIPTLGRKRDINNLRKKENNFEDKSVMILKDDFVEFDDLLENE
jgi:hypothetical protein